MHASQPDGSIVLWMIIAAGEKPFMKIHVFVGLAAFLLLGGCDTAKDEFDRWLKTCTAAENNGILESAQQGCQAALTIAEKEGYPPAEISALLYRLGRIERQRDEFAEAETLVRRSLAIEEQTGDQTAIALRLIELSLSLAGQGRWEDGTQVRERASPLVGDLVGSDRKAAASAFRGFSLGLGALGETALAERFQAEAEQLKQATTHDAETAAAAGSPNQEN